MPAFRWEKGYRCHGYWHDEIMIGRVGVGPRHGRKPGDTYSWEIFPHGGTSGYTQGEAKNLREAKKVVERHFEAHPEQLTPQQPQCW